MKKPFKRGDRPYNIPNWQNIRKSILDRDNYRCRICKNDDRELEVHHIDYDRKRNNDDNLVTLCTTCHRGVHMERYKPCDHEEWPVPWGAHPEYSDPP